MRITLQKLIPVIVIVTFILTGCEKEEILMSSSKVDGQLQSTWEKVEMTATNPSAKVSWKFSDGKVYLIKHETVLATGNYKVDASMTKVNVVTSDFPSGVDYMNGKWTVITLDDDILVMAETYSGGTYEVEFTKKK